jgi:phosphatidylinositol alpha-1,6-mannosyltransferase
MRIAFLTPETNPRYGWTRYAYDLAQALTTQGFEIVALTQTGAQRYGDFWQDVRPVLPSLVPQPRGFLLRSLVAATKVRQAAADCDLVHVIAEPYTPLAARTNKILVVTAHGTYVPQTARRPLVGAFYRRAYQRAFLIAVSHYTKQQVEAALPHQTARVIHNGVHVARFQQPAPAPVKQGPTVLASGGVKPRKGTHLLIETLAQVRQQIPNVQLVVTGRQDDPDYLNQITTRAAALGINDQIHLVGQISDEELRGWYQNADVFALPSLNIGDKFEGFGLVFLEASACGLPVIGAKGSGVEEAILADQTGLLVPQNDAPALADAITRVLTDPALRSKLGATGRDYAQTQDWSVVAQQVAAVYHQLLS